MFQIYQKCQGCWEVSIFRSYAQAVANILYLIQNRRFCMCSICGFIHEVRQLVTNPGTKHELGCFVKEPTSLSCCHKSWLLKQGYGSSLVNVSPSSVYFTTKLPIAHKPVLRAEPMQPIPVGLGPEMIVMSSPTPLLPPDVVLGLP